MDRRPATRRLALPLLLILLGPAGPARAGAPEAVETDDEALADIRRAVTARDAEALLRRVGGAGVEGADRLVSPGWVKKNLTGRGEALRDWVFGPRAPPKGKQPPFSMARCLGGEIELQRTGADRAEVRCAAAGGEARFGLGRFQGRWAITRDFFWPNDPAGR